MRQVNKRDSLYVSLLRLVTGALAAAILAFFCLTYVGEYVVVRWYHESHYVERKEKEYITSLQEYVERNAISIQDSKAITEWVKEQKILSMKIYQNQWLIYDSYYKRNLENLTEEEREQKYSEWENYYQIQFPDGNGEVVLYGAYQSQLYNFATVLELLSSFTLFLILLFLGIRRKTEDIRRLGKEIEILEGGNLDYEITVRGRDELAALAQGLDGMRRSLRDQIRQEAQLVKENKEIVTEMSHDLRTPLTSILLYTEILQKEVGQKGVEKRKVEEYLEKIAQKARRLKQLSDHLFEYALVSEDSRIQMEEPEVYKTFFYDLLSETCSYLEQKGFHTEPDMKWEPKKIQVDEMYLSRIMDNITSNILKYARKDRPVQILCSCGEEEMCLFFENTVKGTGENTESTKVGLQNVRKMMERMGGSCQYGQKGEQFYVALFFPHT